MGEIDPTVERRVGALARTLETIVERRGAEFGAATTVPQRTAVARGCYAEIKEALADFDDADGA